jgi:serine/threonine-protein kinase
MSSNPERSEPGSGATTEPLVVDRYLLCDAIGRGGMAQVHLGRVLGAAGFSRLVAIKRLRPDVVRGRGYATMLVDEARLASRVRHRNVVQMLDVVDRGDELLLVMEYVHGVAIAHLLNASRERGERVPLPITLRIGLDLLAGLQAAHDAKGARGQPLQLVHRDISPQNVLVGVDGVSRIIDFGIAKADRKLAMTKPGQVKGTLVYMAPEQLRAESVDRRTDLYAAGLVLWELAVGSRAVSVLATNLLEAIREALATTIPRPGERAGGIPPALEAVIMTALNREPAKRYPTADAMAAALEQVGEPATPKAVTAWVEELAGPLLAERSKLISRVERLSLDQWGTTISDAVPAHVAASKEDSALLSLPAGVPARGGLAKRILALVVVGASIAFVASLFLRSRRAPPARASSPPPVDTFASAPLEAASSPEVVASIEPPAATSTRAAPSRSPAVRASPKPKAIPSCDPPYTVNARGIRIPRRECL